MLVEKRLLTGLGVADARAAKYRVDLDRQFAKNQIDTPLRMAHFLAQVVHESLYMRVVAENMNYSAARLLQVFSKYFTAAQAKAYERKPQRIGSRVYGGRMGNGDEASGDGYRYRGRGLIQLTGKSNYRKFAEWIGADVVTQPDLVASQYAVHSAVYYWVSRSLNELADIDDVKQVTKRVNGGYNGLPDRVALLDKAKAILAVKAEPVVQDGVTHTTTATKLNLRSRPQASPATWMASLNQGTEVMQMRAPDGQGWMLVRLSLNGQTMQGFVASRYLRRISAAQAAPSAQPPPARVGEIPPAHLSKDHRDITRKRNGGRAHPLGEAGRPLRSTGTATLKARSLVKIVTYLDSEKPQHQRYWPKGGTTYCNIYTHDYCYLAGVYLPRVWWKDAALQEIRSGPAPRVSYGGTVRELNANALHDWFEDYGSSFGWKRVLDLDVLQAAANNGEVCIIVAQRRDLNRSGHITAVVPEHDRSHAIRGATGEVLRPLESQAGVKNYRFFAKSKAWWMDRRFQSFSFWRHS